MNLVVVGVDGSDGAVAALDEAMTQAKLRRIPLRVVCAWRIQTELFGVGGFSLAIDPATNDIYREAAEQVVKEAVERARQAGTDCDGEAVEGHAASVLLQEAEGAALVVVGKRGHGGFGSLLPAST